MRVRWRNKLQVYVTHAYSVNAHAIWLCSGKYPGVRKYSITLLQFHKNQHLKSQWISPFILYCDWLKMLQLLASCHMGILVPSLNCPVSVYWPMKGNSSHNGKGPALSYVHCITQLKMQPLQFHKDHHLKSQWISPFIFYCDWLKVLWPFAQVSHGCLDSLTAQWLYMYVCMHVGLQRAILVIM